MTPILREPFKGYTWPFTQHAVALERRNLFGLLRAAARFAGRKANSGRLSSFLVSDKILTHNIRTDSDRADAWRDYQQVLPELGLIVSTDVSSVIVITPVGLSLLDGSLGVSETLTNQALRYQYPNGFKWQISQALRDRMGNSAENHQSLADAHAAKGILLRPAVLLLRYLIMLTRDGHRPWITELECAQFALPIARNTDWHMGYAALLDARKRNIKPTPFGVRRNIQDWYKFLDKTDIFEIDKERRLTLRDDAQKRIAELDSLCARLEDPASFWIYTKGATRYSWFEHFGSEDIDRQWVAKDLAPDYVDSNYLVGPETDIAGDSPLTSNSDISLVDYSPPQNNFPPPKGKSAENMMIDWQKVIADIQDKTKLHHLIVMTLASHLSAKGCEVKTSASGQRESVDLYARKGKQEAIFEVKTLNARNWKNRIRLGIGQLSEYRYRWEKQDGGRPAASLVLSVDKKFDPWMLDFLENDAEMGLIGFRENRFIPYTNTVADHFI